MIADEGHLLHAYHGMCKAGAVGDPDLYSPVWVGSSRCWRKGRPCCQCFCYYRSKLSDALPQRMTLTEKCAKMGFGGGLIVLPRRSYSANQSRVCSLI